MTEYQLHVDNFALFLKIVDIRSLQNYKNVDI